MHKKKYFYILITSLLLNTVIAQESETNSKNLEKKTSQISNSLSEKDKKVDEDLNSDSKFKKFFSKLVNRSNENKEESVFSGAIKFDPETGELLSTQKSSSTNPLSVEDAPQDSSSSKLKNFFSKFFNRSSRDSLSDSLLMDKKEQILEISNSLKEIIELVYEGKDVQANAGTDIAMPSGSVVILDASGSTPKSEFLTYEWSFPPDFLYKGDYSFSVTDDIELYEDAKSENYRSIKKIITQNKYIEIELPNKKSGSKFSLNLKVKSEYGKTDESSISVLFLDQVEPLFNNAFSYGATKDSSSAQRVYDFFIESEVNEFANAYGDSSIHRISRPNQIALNKEFLSIQPVNKQNASLQEIELINDMIFNQCKTLGINNVLDPNRKISPTVQTKKYIQKNIVVSDTLIALNDNTPLFKKAFKQFKSKLKNDSNSKDQNIDSTSVLEKKEPLSIPQLFKSYQKEDVNNYYSLDSTSFQDTLEYEELEDLALIYNSGCLNDSCGAENAFLEGVGQLLTWSIDDSSEISFHYYDLTERLKKDPQWIWKSSSDGIKPDYSESIKPSDVMMDQGTMEAEKVSEDKRMPRVYLSQDIYAAVEVILSNQIMKKRNFAGRVKERNQKAMTLVKKKPIIFAVSVAMLTQGVSMLIKGEEDSKKDLPPGKFPPI